MVDDVTIPSTYFANPANSCLPQALISDADSDGVADADDAYPNDASRAYNNLIPAPSFGTLMFEDLWPAIVAISGAKYHGAEWLSNAANGTENDQTFANIIVFDDAQKILPSPGGIGSNTIPTNPRVAPDTTNITITFATNGENAVSVSDIIFNPYIIVNQVRGKEVHLPNFVPSSKVNNSFFGTMQDDSNPGGNKYYKTKNNLPWALNVVQTIPYTHSTNDFIFGYLKFAEWAQSNGTLYTDWYLNLPEYRDNTKLFSY